MTILFFAAALLLSALPFLTGTVYYMVADDYLLNYIANGSYGWTWSDHLTFLKMPAGIALRFLYGLTTDINWYLVMLLGVSVLSFTVLHDLVWRRTRSPIALAVSLLVNYYVIGNFLSFTVTAYLAAGAGFTCLLTALGKGESAVSADTKSQGRAPLLPVAAAFLLAAFILRKDALIGATAVFLPLLLLALLHLPASLRAGELKLPALLVPAAAFLLLLSGIMVLERAAYSSPEWQTFQQYDEARSLVVDSYATPYKGIREELTELGLTKLDYNLLSSWRYCEKDFFTEEMLRSVAAVKEAGTTTEDRLRYGRSHLNPRLYPFLAAPLILLLSLLLTRRLRHPLPAIAILLVTSALLALFAFYRMRFVMRVVIPTELLSAYALLLLCRADRSNHPLHQVLPDAGTALLLGLILLQFLRYYVAINPMPRDYCENSPLRELTEEIASHPDTLYALDSSVLSRQFYYGTPASQVKTTDRFRNIVRTGSWDSYSPRYYEQMKEFLEDPDNLLTEMVREEQVLYVTGSGAEEIAAFYKERTGETVTPSGVEYPGSGVTIWSF